ncbi:PTS sugar transporter subunit IIB [Fonticella tunisiensis]|uniref:PTS system cellobiose-specific IIB component n=1 Tax=Fonticella tunisiensis TaxID=1096341 RepID=A0A4R7KBH1_9CLOT|nr:PTS sugar transporter subunit IIB [Fonticella tunisiensis]TDT51878.1 PTS system cellobiose-specific IIB component [Fonticella tunisiensis]
MKVLMVCSGGMSSAIVVKAIKQEADKQGFPLEIKAVGTGEFEEELKTGGYDLAIVAPQVKHRMDVFKEQASSANVPIELIVPMGYTPIGAPKVLEQIKKHVK